MPRVRIRSALSDVRSIDAEIARLRDLSIGELRARWRTVFKRRAPAPLPRHLLFRTLAYRLQADQFGDLGRDAIDVLDRSASPDTAGQRAVARQRQHADIRPGTILGREWKGRMQRVTVLAHGFSWNGKTYRSLSKVAVAITGTNWNGPKFFGLRDKQKKAPG
jgi:hypothetical protein